MTTSIQRLAGLTLIVLLGVSAIGGAQVDTWTQKADMPTARNWFATSVVNGKIYAIGGILAADDKPVPVVEEYDPATDTWTRKNDMPTPRGAISTSVVNDKIYVIGGGASSIVEEYEPKTDTWKRKADMPTLS